MPSTRGEKQSLGIAGSERSVPSKTSGKSAAMERRMVRRPELRRIVPLSDTTIYELEQRGEFPRRFRLTPRCVVWDLAEIHAWLNARQSASVAGRIERALSPDVRLRQRRRVRTEAK